MRKRTIIPVILTICIIIGILTTTLYRNNNIQTNVAKTQENNISQNAIILNVNDNLSQEQKETITKMMSKNIKIKPPTCTTWQINHHFKKFY